MRQTNIPDDSSVPSLVNNQAVLVGNFESGSPEWHAARAKGLGGSEIAAVVGLSEWDSRFSLYYRKRDKLDGIEITDPIKWGTLLEPVIYAEYAANELKRGQRITTGHTFHHIDRPWQIANPDGLIWAGDELVDLLEIKNVGRPDFWGRSGSDIVPIYYRCQIAWYCDVLGLERAVIRALVGGNDPRTYRIRPEPGDLEFLRAEGAQFIADLEAGVEPNLDGHMATYTALKELHPKIEERSVQISSRLADEWWRVCREFDEAELNKNAIKSQLQMKMGLAKIAMAGEQKVAYRQKPPRGDGDPFIKSAPDPEKKARKAIAEESAKARAKLAAA